MYSTSLLNEDLSLRKVPGSRTQDRAALKNHGSISDNPRHSHYPYITGEKLGIWGAFSKQWNKKEVTVELNQVPLNETVLNWECLR